MPDSRRPRALSGRSPVRVTHIVHDFEGGGLETLVASMIRNVDRDRVTASVLSLSGRKGRLGHEIEQEGYRARAVKPLPLVSMFAPISLRGALRELETD